MNPGRTPIDSRRRARPAGLLVVLAAAGWGGCSPGEPVADLAATSAGVVGEIELAAATQAEIWTLEHVTFKLEQYVGKPLSAAILAGDAAAIDALVTADAQGSLPVGDPEIRRVRGMSEQRRTSPDRPAAAVGRDDLVRFLATLHDRFGAASKAGLRVLRIDRGADGTLVWTARVLLTVEGTAPDGGPAAYSSEFDAEFRLDPDLAGDAIEKLATIARLEPRSESFRTARRYLMEEVTDAWGLGALPIPDNWKLPPEKARGHRFQFAVEDFDGDGWLDVCVSSYREPRLLRNVEGRRFEDVTEAAGIAPAPGHPRASNALTAWIDVDGDDRPDLLAGSRLFRNVDGRRFTDISADSGLRLDQVPFGAIVADYDADGDLDLYVIYQRRADTRTPERVPWVGDTESGGANALWLNDGRGRFVETTHSAGADGGRRQTFAAAALLWDDDRYPDLYAVNDLGLNVLLRNRGDGTFEDITQAAGLADYSTSMGVAAGDLDDDGAPEIYVANMYSKMGRRIIGQVGPDDYPPGIFEQIKGSCAGNTLYSRSGGAGRAAEFAAAAEVNDVGWAYAPAMADFDGDGRLDLYATTGYQSVDRAKPDG